jgi:hypothetical protein
VLGRTRIQPAGQGPLGQNPLGQGPLGRLPASWRGELPNAGGSSRWQVDLAADGSYQLRQTWLNRPAPNTFDDIGLWRLEPSGQRLVCAAPGGVAVSAAAGRRSLAKAARRFKWHSPQWQPAQWNWQKNPPQPIGPNQPCGAPPGHCRRCRHQRAQTLINPPGRRPEQLLATDSERLSGNSGCNRLLGGFQLVGGQLRFSHW